MAQIGTIKVETAGGPVELPVYDLGDSGSNRIEAFRVQTASGPGFVPLAAVDEADRPYLRVQTGNGVKAFDTSASGIPDSLIQDFDPSQESTGTISTITDQEGTADLTGSTEVISSGINNTQSFRFGGSSSDRMSHSTTLSTSDPVAFVFAAEQQEAQDSNNFYFDGGSEFEFAFHDNGGTEEPRVHRGGTNNETTNDINDGNANVWTFEAVNGSDVAVRKNGSDIETISLSASDLTGLSVAGAAGRDDLNLEVDFGRSLVLNNPSDSDITDAETIVADQHNISI